MLSGQQQAQSLSKNVGIQASGNGEYFRRSVVGQRNRRIDSFSYVPPKFVDSVSPTLKSVSPERVTPRPSASFTERPTPVLTRPTTPALSKQSPSQVLHRSSFGPKIVGRYPKIRSRRRVKVPVIFGVVIVMFVLGGLLAFNSWHSKSLAKTQVAVLAKTTDEKDISISDTPDEVEPDQNGFANYMVGPDLPRFLRIAKLHINARVKRVWVNTDNELKLPSSIFDAGWYEGSAKPGQGGTVLINGYVSGPSKQGIFSSLDALEPNDIIELERGNGKLLHYKVVRQQAYDYDKIDMAAALTSGEPGKPGLNIMTTSGLFETDHSKPKQRILVLTVQVD